MKHIAFVDPFSSQTFLATQLKSAGLQITAIYTQKFEDMPYFSPRAELFDHVFYLNEEEGLAGLIKNLITAGVERIYYGLEISIAIADELANTICPEFANSPITSAYRFDKYEMQEALRQAGLSYLEQIKVKEKLTTEQENELMAWEYPVIIKPVNAGASMGVECCFSLEEVKRYFLKQKNINIFGQDIPYYTIQKYLQGTEHIVDTFSAQGKHYVSGVLQTTRTLCDGIPICLYSEIISPESKEAHVCIKYVKEVLDAVGLMNGFGHVELMLTANGPYLIEVNPRISGAHGFVNKLFQQCGFPAQVDLLIANCKQMKMPVPNKIRYGRRVCLQNYEERVIHPLNMSLLKELPSFQEALMLKEPGTFQSKPKLLSDSIAFLTLAHEDEEQVKTDYQKLLQWEKSFQLF